MQPVVQLPKLWHLTYLVSEVSSAMFNIWLVTHINPYFILLILVTNQISSGLHGLGIKFKTTQPIIVQNFLKMQIMLEFSTEEGQFHVLYILCLVFLSAVNYRFNQIQHLNPLIDKLDACKNLSRKKVYPEMHGSLSTTHWRTYSKLGIKHKLYLCY